MKVVRSSPLRTGRLCPQEFSWYSFIEAESTPGYMVPSVASEKIPSDTTGDFFVLCTSSVLLLCPDCPGCDFCPYCTTHNTNIHATSGIRTRNPRKRSAVDRSATGAGPDSETLRLVAQCLNHYATPGPALIRNSALDRVEWLTLHSNRCTPRILK